MSNFVEPDESIQWLRNRSFIAEMRREMTSGYDEMHFATETVERMTFTPYAPPAPGPIAPEPDTLDAIDLFRAREVEESITALAKLEQAARDAAVRWRKMRYVDGAISAFADTPPQRKAITTKRFLREVTTMREVFTPKHEHVTFTVNYQGPDSVYLIDDGRIGQLIGSYAWDADTGEYGVRKCFVPCADALGTPLLRQMEEKLRSLWPDVAPKVSEQ